MYTSAMQPSLTRYREAVRKAVRASWKRGVPAFQAQGGYLIALYPDGRRVKLQRLENWTLQEAGGNGTSKNLAARRTKRRG